MGHTLQALFRSAWHFIHSGVSRSRGLGPLSSRGVILLIALTYLFWGPISAKVDIISASLAYGLLGVLALAAILVIGQGLWLRRRCVLTIFPPGDEVSVEEPVRIAVSLPPLRILPLTSLDLIIESPHTDLPNVALRVTGVDSRERQLAIDMRLPHRGSWDLSAVRCELRDVAGLCRYCWTQPLSIAVVVAPPVVTETRLPLISSTQRQGDMVPDTLNRQGDPFDIKAYHPSDGMKKIVWKAFAKRGELLSRHPEASMTPEGYIVMLVVARTEDDDVCANALAYAQAVTELSLDIVVSCEGCKGRTPATSVREAKTLVIDSVWDAEGLDGTSLESDAMDLIDFCSSQALKMRVRKMLIFCSGSRITDPNAARDLLSLATWLSHQGIEPIFSLTEPRSLRTPQQHKLRKRMLSLFVEPSESERDAVPVGPYQQFLADCLSRQWEVYV